MDCHELCPVGRHCLRLDLLDHHHRPGQKLVPPQQPCFNGHELANRLRRRHGCPRHIDNGQPCPVPDQLGHLCCSQRQGLVAVEAQIQRKPLLCKVVVDMEEEEVVLVATNKAPLLIKDAHMPVVPRSNNNNLGN